MLGTSSKTTPRSPWLISVGHGLSLQLQAFFGGLVVVVVVVVVVIVKIRKDSNQ